MPNTQNNDIPKNMFLAGYYVNSTMGGVSMEASCETGVNAGKKIIDKYNIKYNGLLPIKHTNEILLEHTQPFIYFDKILYKLNLPPIVNLFDSIFILFFCLILIIIVLFLCK